MNRSPKISTIRALLYGDEPGKLTRAADVIRDSFSGNVVVSSVQANREGDYRLFLRIYLKEAV